MIKGEVTIIKRNELDEVKEITTHENTITGYTPYGVGQHDAREGGENFDFNPRFWRIGIAGNATNGRMATKEISTKMTFSPIILLTTLPAGAVYGRKFPNGSPAPYWEFNGRLPLAALGSEETFNHVLLGTTQNTTKALAYIVLDTPCIQGPSEVIDFVYRLYFYEDTLRNTNTWYGVQNYWKHVFNSQIGDTDAAEDEWLGVDRTTTFDFVPHHHNIAKKLGGQGDDALREFETFWNSGRDILNAPASSNTNYNYFATSSSNFKTNTTNIAVSELSNGIRTTAVSAGKESVLNGQVFTSVRLYNNLLQFLPANNYLYDTINYNSPIQVIHNHNKNAIRPASDVDYLAGSASRPNANGINWTNLDFPKHYRLEVNGNGDTGATTYYNFAVRDFIITDNDTGTGNELYWTTSIAAGVGFPWLGGIYTSRGSWPEDDAYVQGSGNDPLQFRELQAIDPTGISSGVGMHGVTHINQYNRFRYNSDLAKTHIMTHDQEGITLTHIHKGWFWNFDSARTNMNFSYLTQTTTDSNNNIWCCDRNEGLIRISDIIGSPTANVMAVATNSIQTGDCYGVCFTGNNRIYAMFEGGLVYSDNPTLNDSNSITFTNSTFTARSSERSNITGLIGDPEHSDHHLAVMFANTTVGNITQDIFWHTGSTQTTVKGNASLETGSSIVFDYGGIHDGYVLNQKYLNTLLHCSDRNSVWFGHISEPGDASPANSGPIPKLFYFNNVPYYPSFPQGDHLTTLWYWNATSWGMVKLDSGLNFNGVPYVFDKGRLDTAQWSLPEGQVTNNTAKVNGANIGSNRPARDTTGGGMFFPNSTGLGLAGKTDSSILYEQRSSNPFDYYISGHFSVGVNTNGAPLYTRDSTYTPYAGEINNNVAWNGRGPLSRAISWRRYGWDGAAWVEGYGQAFDDTTVNNTDLKRIGFDWNSPIFAGDAYCDGDELFTKGLFGASDDATFAFSIDLRDKYYQADTGQCVFDFHEPYTDNRISLWMNFKNRYSESTSEANYAVYPDLFGYLEHRSTENIVLIANATGNTTYIDTGISGKTYMNADNIAFGANTRVVVTVDNTNANVYINGTQIGGVALTNPIDFRNLTGNAKFYIGVDAISDITGTSLPMHFVNGRMSDFSVNNDKWAISEIENDYTSHSTTNTTTVPADNLVAQWLMAESLQDGKQTHTNEEEIEDGIKVSWPSAPAPNESASWEDRDYWTFVVSDGIFKDNTNEFYWQSYEYNYPLDYNFTEITNTSARTDRVMFSMNAAVISPTTYNTSNILTEYAPSNLGHVFDQRYSVTTNSGQKRWYSLPCESGFDFTFSAFIETANNISSTAGDFLNGIFVSNAPNVAAAAIHSDAMFDYSYWIEPDATIAGNRSTRVYENGVIAYDDASSNWKIGDKLTIQKTGTTVTYSRNGVVTRTTPGAPADRYYVGVSVGNYGGWSNVEFTYTPPSNVKFIGNNATKTGYQHKDFFRTQLVGATIDAADAQIIRNDDFYLNKPAPGANQVISDSVGYIVVNNADIAKTFTANVVLGYTNHPGPDY